MTFKLRIRIIACLCLSPFLSIAQVKPDSYAAAWRKVDTLINIKGLPQSALTQVNQIYTRAQQEKNEPQLLKALIYRIQLQNGNQEDAGIKAISDLGKEIPGTTQPARSILQNLLASLYWNYFQQHRYQFYNRTKTENFQKDSIATWGAEDFHKKTGQLFLASLQEEKLLQATLLDAYDPIIIKGNVRALRPSLFDLLAHRALNYFKSDERDVTKPTYAFEIDDPAVFSDAAIFTRHTFKTSDSSSLHHKALLLFQRLISLHLADAKPDALLDVDIERMSFAHNYAVMENKDELYTAALARITDRWSNEPAASEAWYLQALEHVNKGSSYNPPKDTSGRYEYVAAKSICDKIIAQKDSSEGKVHCTQLLRQILVKSLQLQIENVNIPGQPFRSLVSWRNFSRLHGRIVRISRDERINLGDNYYQDEYWQKLLKLPVQQTFTRALPGTDDYQQHQVEINVDALPIGSYALIAGDDSAFGLGRHLLSVAYFFVSKIAYINNDRDYFVLDRESGQPLSGAAIQVWARTYDRKARGETFIRAESYQTDEHGHFRMKKRDINTSNTPVALEITAGSDHLFMDETFNLYYEQSRPEEGSARDKTKYEKDYLRTWFFTDRSIYRPGQTVYFKGIVQTRDFDTHKASILPQFRTKVILYDVNDSKVDSLSVTTNDFGSYHGQFRLPEHLLNGAFTIRDDSSGTQQSFAVEEYKRPLFFVSYDTLKGTYRVGDTIRVRGSAKAYAGNVIDGAMVKYTVRRQARVPCFDCWPMAGRFLPGRNNVQEIAHGTAMTDAQGRFTISFAATPDRTVNKATDPVFEYTVAADVTDLNGETRSESTVVKAGYKTLQLTIARPSDDAMPSDSLKSLVVSARNLNDAPEPASVDIVMYALKAPDRLIRKRYWDEPDQFILSKEEYLRNFPHDEYSNETNAANWEKGTQIWQISDSAGKSLNIGKSLSPGWYVIEARSKDKFGQPVKVIRYISLFEAGTGKPATPQYAWSLQDEETVEPGGKATVDIGSSAENVFVIRKLSTPGSDSLLAFLTLDKGKKSTTFPVTETHRGGFGISDVFVKDNRIYTRTFTVHVPWTNKELSIHYDTYRDKVLPGSEEKWKVTIKGHQADKVAAEALAGMYDASLDQFKYHGWSVPDLYPIFSSGMPWKSAGNFASATAMPRYIQEWDYPSFLKQYDELMTFDGGNRYGQQIRIRGARTMAPGQPGAMLNVAVKGSDMYVRAEKMSANVSRRVPGVLALYKDGDLKADSVAMIVPELPADPAAAAPVQIRKNFSETAFFFPELKTDDSGSIAFSFTMPEALTKWKWMMLAHTKDLSFGYSEKTVVTQKKLMVQPNAPRFLREGDRMELGVKVVNLTDSEMTGQIELQLIDPTTGLTADGMFSNRQANQYFTVAAGQSSIASFPLDIPYQYNRPLTYRIIARSKEYSDGEEAVLPVVSNRMLVTESLPLNLPADGTKEFHFDKLLQSGSSETLSHHALTVEFTSNPAWYAVQALPYLMEYPYECAEQTFNRFYANALASRIAGSSPRIKQIFDKWKTTDTAALLSNLEKNQELKSVLLQETPWVLQGKTESQQKQHIALLFDMVRMSRELESSLAKLKDMQSDNGGFVWFKGGPDDRYITQYILTGIGHLQKLNAIPPSMAARVKAIVQTALPYLDAKLKKDYEDILKQQKSNKPLPSGKTPVPAGKVAGPVWIGEMPVQYLYMRSFFSDYGIPGDVFPAVNYFRKQARDGWLQTSKYMQGMIALALFRTGDGYTAKNILASLKETAIRDEERGMYWKGMEGGYYWWQAPIEIQSLLTEAFHEIAPASDVENALRTWLLRQKQTHNWTTTKATADACYALLMGNSDWLSAERKVDIRLGSKTASSDAADAEAGTGYFKKVFDGPFVQPSMGNITVTMKTAGTGSPASPAGGSPAWGAVYWQYFENLDKITSAANAKAPLKLTKKLFREKNTDRGPVLEPVPENGVLHPGDKVKVRIEIQSDRSMEYVHMKDMRAACMEPVNVLSGYKWQGGLGYYESTRDASTDFFFSYLPRGTFVFEYPLFVGQNGNFSNGVTSIECMYAPEFSYHSEGIRVNVEEAKP